MGTDKGHGSGSHYKQVDTDVYPAQPHGGHTPRPDDHRCDQMQRIDKLERRVDKHEALLSDGRNEFTAIRKDIQRLSEIILELSAKVERSMEKADRKEAEKPTATDKLKDALIFWAAPIIGGSVLWLIQAAGNIPKGVHP